MQAGAIFPRNCSPVLSLKSKVAKRQKSIVSSPQSAVHGPVWVRDGSDQFGSVRRSPDWFGESLNRRSRRKQMRRQPGAHGVTRPTLMRRVQHRPGLWNLSLGLGASDPYRAYRRAGAKKTMERQWIRHKLSACWSRTGGVPAYQGGAWITGPHDHGPRERKKS